MTELLKALGFLSALLGLTVWYELSGKRATFTAKVLEKQRRPLEGRADLFYVEIWYECPNGPNVYSLFVDRDNFKLLDEGMQIEFSAKEGRVTGWLYNRELID